MRTLGRNTLGGLLMGLAGLLALGSAGCAHRGATYEYREVSGSEFRDAYDRVASGADRSLEVGKYLIERTEDGAVRVYDRSRGVASRSAEFVEDSWITSKVKSKYYMEKSVKARDINVDTDAGVVILRGTVRSPGEAEDAIKLALDTKGVRAVRSELNYPIGRRQAKTYAPGDQPRLRR